MEGKGNKSPHPYGAIMLPKMVTDPLQAVLKGRQEVGGGITSDIEVTDLTFDFPFLPNTSKALVQSTFSSLST